MRLAAHVTPKELTNAMYLDNGIHSTLVQTVRDDDFDLLIIGETVGIVTARLWAAYLSSTAGKCAQGLR